MVHAFSATYIEAQGTQTAAICGWEHITLKIESSDAVNTVKAKDRTSRVFPSNSSAETSRVIFSKTAGPCPTISPRKNLLYTLCYVFVAVYKSSYGKTITSGSTIQQRDA